MQQPTSTASPFKQLLANVSNVPMSPLWIKLLSQQENRQGNNSHTDSRVVRTGMLSKTTSGKLKRWQRRSFSLSVDGQLKYARNGRDVGGGMQVDDCFGVSVEDCIVVLRVDYTGKHAIRIKANCKDDALSWCSAIEKVMQWCNYRTKPRTPSATSQIDDSLGATFLCRRKLIVEASQYFALRKFVAAHIATQQIHAIRHVQRVPALRRGQLTLEGFTQAHIAKTDPGPQMSVEAFAQKHIAQVDAVETKFPSHILEARGALVSSVICRRRRRQQRLSDSPTQPHICSTSSVYEHREQQELISVWMERTSSPDPTGTSSSLSTSSSGSPGKRWRKVFQRFAKKQPQHIDPAAVKQQPPFGTPKSTKQVPSRLAKRRSLRLSAEKLAIAERAKMVEVEERRRWHDGRGVMSVRP
jgi:hypothetical protein